MRHRIRRHARTARYIFYKETLIDFKEHLWTFLGSFAGIALLGLLNSKYFSPIDNLFLIGSFGASSVLGGATALIANIGSAKIQALGYLYVLSPVLSGAIILFLVAVFFNNRTAHRSYPKNKNWYKIWNRYKR